MMARTWCTDLSATLIAVTMSAVKGLLTKLRGVKSMIYGPAETWMTSKKNL